MKKNIIVLGISGMLGSAIFKILSKNENFNVYGTLKNKYFLNFFNKNTINKIIINVNALDDDAIKRAIESTSPFLIINCIGLIKQIKESTDALTTIPINSLLPHKLEKICSQNNIKLLQISTDCVFSGSKGNYYENDFPDCSDLYGRSKLLGEVCDSKFALTLRTSIIGHELKGKFSLLDWYLGQSQPINGYKNAIFSGLTTLELANIIERFIVPKIEMCGLYHVASSPISKYDLLNIIAKTYNKKIQIKPCFEPIINRSLNADKFNVETGYKCPDWNSLIASMYEDFYR